MPLTHTPAMWTQQPAEQRVWVVLRTSNGFILGVTHSPEGAAALIRNNPQFSDLRTSHERILP